MQRQIYSTYPTDKMYDKTKQMSNILIYKSEEFNKNAQIV